MHNQGSALPFPADQLISGSWVNDPMNTQFPVPQKQVFMQYPNLQWVLSMTASILVSSFQQNANGGPISAFAYNLFSSNGYNNQFWLIIVDEASDFALEQLQQQANANPQQVVHQAITFYAGYAAAACVNKWPELQRYLNQEQYARVQGIISQWNSLHAPAQHYHQQAHNPATFASSPQGSGITSPHVGTYAFSMNAMQEKSRYGNASGRRAIPDARRTAQVPDELQDLGVMETSTHGTVAASHGAPVQTPYVSPTALRPRVRPKPQPLDGSAPAAAPEPLVAASAPVTGQYAELLPLSNDIPSLDILGDDTEWADAMEADYHQRTASGHYEVNDTPTPAYTVEKIGRFVVRPKNPDVTLPLTLEEAGLEEDEDLETLEVISLPQGDDDFSVLELEDGNVAVQVLASDPGRTWTEDQPHNHPYDPKKHFRYLVQIDQDLTYEVFMPRDPDVNYEDLEFVGSERAAARQNRLSDQTILADLSVLQEITPKGAPYTIISALTNLETANNAADQSKGLEEVEKFQGRLTFFEGVLPKTDVPAMLFHVDQLFAQVRARNAVSVTYGQTEQQFLVEGLGKKVSEANHASLKDRLGKLILLIGDLQTLGPRAYVSLNQLLTRRVNRLLDPCMGFGDVSITNFAEDYMDLLEEIEKDHGDKAMQKFHETASASLAHVSLEYAGAILTVKQTYTMIGLPVGMASFGLPSATGESYVVLSTNAPALHTVLEGAKQDDGRPKNTVTYLNGRDGEVFEVLESAWDDSFKTLIRL